MPRYPSTSRSSAYLDALSQEIEKKLQRALGSPTQRRELLQALFADIAFEVDDKAKEKMCLFDALDQEPFEAQVEDDAALLRYSSALVQGAANVFWIDIQTNSRLFQTLFCHLHWEVALNPAQLNKIPVQAQRELYLSPLRFMFFYKEVDKLERFLKHRPVFPNAFLVGGSSDIFVTELSDQKLEVVHYLSQLRMAQALD